jgi:predicted nuclease of predicted toxin-antitoxin system
MLTVVIDEDMPRSTASVLASIGFMVLDIRDCGLRGESDEEIFRFAQEKRAVLISGDHGFANLLRFPLGSHSGIIIAHFPNEMPSDLLNEQIASLLKALTESDFPGNLIILEPGRVRIRRKM